MQQVRSIPQDDALYMLEMNWGHDGLVKMPLQPHGEPNIAPVPSNP